VDKTIASTSTLITAGWSISSSNLIGFLAGFFVIFFGSFFWTSPSSGGYSLMLNLELFKGKSSLKLVVYFMGSSFIVKWLVVEGSYGVGGIFSSYFLTYIGKSSIF